MPSSFSSFSSSNIEAFSNVGFFQNPAAASRQSAAFFPKKRKMAALCRAAGTKF